MKPKSAHRGFTLIELGVVMGLLALVTAVAIPSFNAVTAAGLRSSVSMIAGMTREAYARAAITGKVHRIVFDLDKGSYWLERTEDRFVLPSEKLEADRDGRGGIKVLEEEQRAADEKSGGAAAGGSGAEGGAMGALAMYIFNFPAENLGVSDRARTAVIMFDLDI